MSGTNGRDQARLANRELSWLLFNHRVQMEGDNPQNPLLERAKFLAIVTSNLDEFLQVRYHGVCEAAESRRARERMADGYTPEELYRRVNKEILHQQNLQYLLYEGVQSELYLQGVQMYPIFVLDDAMLARVREVFRGEIEGKLKPLDWDEGAPPTRQKWLHLCVKLHSGEGRQARFVLIALPASLPRVFELPSPGPEQLLIRLEDVVKLCLPMLFPGEEVREAATFRILRNQDFPTDARDDDIVPAVRDMLRRRRTGKVMRLEAEERMSAEMLELLTERFSLAAERRYRVTGPLDLNKLLMTLYTQIARDDLKYAPAEPVLESELMGADVFERIARKDYLLYHPYHSFEPIIHLIRTASGDPDVCAIKMTLYRVSSKSPIVQALADAAAAGKQVTVLFEAHARFDEENNLFWGERLKRAGCNVIFGLPGLKTHSKITLITRMENGELKRYLHLGTGNYHDGTAKLYTDFGLLTADETLGEDATSYFYRLEGRPHTLSMQELADAPERLQMTLLHLIEREKEHALCGRPASITAKMNSLLDPTVIDALYDASGAGVRIELIVRGICALIPERAGLSENIRVTSIVGRNLEHARAFRFENGGEPEVYLSSADWMPRNLLKRVELMFPVKDGRCRRAVENVLALQLEDNQKGWRLHADGRYLRKPSAGKPPVNAQEILLRDVEGVFRGKETTV